MNVLVKFLVVSAHFCPKKAAASEYLRIFFFLLIRPLATGFSWKIANSKPDHVTTVFAVAFAVCSSRLNGRKGLRQGVLQLTIIQPNF